jgi:hypothetical protein
MHQSSADHPHHLRAVEALRASGARIYAGYDRFYCEVRSTLRAMGVSRKGGLRRIMDSGAPLYYRLMRRGGASMFVTESELNRLLALFNRVPQGQDALIRHVQHMHGRAVWYLSWS